MLNKDAMYVPPGGPPRRGRPDPAIFQAMGQERIFQMIEDFYSELEQSSIRPLFPDDMKLAAQRSASFFVFLLGGPPLFQQQYGSPMMRQRHLAFSIDENARQIWLNCFRKILIQSDVKYGFPLEHVEDFWQFLEEFSAWMVNTQ